MGGFGLWLWWGIEQWWDLNSYKKRGGGDNRYCLMRFFNEKEIFLWWFYHRRERLLYVANVVARGGSGGWRKWSNYITPIKSLKTSQLQKKYWIIQSATNPFQTLFHSHNLSWILIADDWECWFLRFQKNLLQTSDGRENLKSDLCHNVNINMINDLCQICIFLRCVFGGNI